MMKIKQKMKKIVAKQKSKFLQQSRMNFFKKVSFYFIFLILFEFLFLISSSYSSQKIPASKEAENHFPPQFLIGIIVSKDTSSSIAILKNERTGKTTILTIGESIFGLILIHVFENRIILQRGEKTFQLFLGRNNLVSAVEKLQENSGKVSVTERKDELLDSNQLNNNLMKKEFNRSEVERRIATEWPLIMKETGFVPNLVNGKISGFKITKLPRKSILSEIGIHKNDVIKEINGIELNDVDALFGLYNKFKEENKFEVSIERNGKLLRLLYILK